MKPRWPTLPNGTVDWPQVFLHPQNGLMASIDEADTSDKLQACMHVIVNSLFSRDSDADVRRTFIAKTDELFIKRGHTLESQKAKINLVLCSIMYDREERAELYAKQQAEKKSAVSEQRLKTDDPLKALNEL